MNLVKQGLLALLILFYFTPSSAQVTFTELSGADSVRKPVPAAKIEPVTPGEFAPLYERAPDSFYLGYLNALIVAKKYKDAEKLVQQHMAGRDDLLLNIDLGCVLYMEGKYDKASAQFNGVLGRINGDPQFTEKIVRAFLDVNLEDDAIIAFERTGAMLGIPYYFNGPLSKLYARCDRLDKAIETLLVNPPGVAVNVENVKSILLELLGEDPVKIRQAQKAILVKLNAQPENPYYNELLTWIFTHKNDWDQALIQIEAIDERNNENGKSLMELAHTANSAKQYDIAEKAFDEVIAKGKDQPYYINARSEKLATGLAIIKNDPAYTQEQVSGLEKEYDSFFTDYPKYYSMQAAADFATLEARYGNNVSHAIEILKKGINEPDSRRAMVGQLKLQLGDYYILAGQLWNASLSYSQVDKEFKQDVTGEDARFRNAKLAYYRGDFDWAQHQLLILKSATSELIANDALYLSVLITENVEDSNIVPLQRFAYADLLLFQNKDKDAETLLDSINKAFPKHPLNDDILMLRANIALKHHEYDKALGYLKNIYEQYPTDVLGDDAVFKMAEIYENDLHQNEQAKHFYEQLIIDYPGSTFVQTARKRLYVLNSSSTNP